MATFDEQASSLILLKNQEAGQKRGSEILLAVDELVC